MPIYEYGCENCGDKFEVCQSIKSNHLETCTKCDGTLKRLISASAFHLKGSGWYKTDYASPKPGESEKKEKTDKPAKEESKKESKKAVTAPASS